MKLHVLAASTFALSLLASCSSTPSQPTASRWVFEAPDTRTIGIVMTPLPPVQAHFPGADCASCLATALTEHQALANQVQTLDASELEQVKTEIARALEAKGLRVRVIAAPLDLAQLPAFSGPGTDHARHDFRGLKTRYGVDKLLVIELSSLGASRPYAGPVPAGLPRLALTGSEFLVNLGDNTLEAQQAVEVQLTAARDWEDPPRFPGLASTYGEVLRQGKAALLRPFL
ncbi:hypothetical protein LRH25_15355 [Ideonella azotifigens]|nr:hypothetical protein [Ideonella azotifigens]MCD2341721.1 hypothetical protein [Ideonella azotifigens]